MLKFCSACQRTMPVFTQEKKKSITNHHSAKSLTIRYILLYVNRTLIIFFQFKFNT